MCVNNCTSLSVVASQCVILVLHCQCQNHCSSGLFLLHKQMSFIKSWLFQAPIIEIESKCAARTFVVDACTRLHCNKISATFLFLKKKSNKQKQTCFASPHCLTNQRLIGNKMQQSLAKSVGLPQ